MTVHVAASVHGHPGADAVQVEDGRIVAIGSAADLGREVLSHGTGALVPALRDSHLHPIGMAAAPGQMDLSSSRSIPEVVDLLRRHLATSSSDVPIIAAGLDDERLTERRLPTAEELDGAGGDRPILVYRQCSHVATANSLALAAGGIDRSTTDPPGGRVRRRADDAPTGVLEENAIRPVAAALAARTVSPDADAVRGEFHRLRRRGIVAVDAMVAAGSSMWCTGGDELGTILELGNDSPVQVNVFVICDTSSELREAARMLAAAGPAVTFGGWKGFADGSLGARTASLRTPYADDPSTSGVDVGEQLDRLAAVAVELGGMAAIHAIGDRAVDRALGIAHRLGPGTVRIEHASVADPEQVAAMAEKGVIASVQPSFHPSDAPWLEARLGPERAGWAYPFASLAAAGVTMRGGSDAPVETADPFIGIRDACLLRPEALDPIRAVALYTASPLTVGNDASFLVCDHDPAEVTPAAIADIAVHEVWIRGQRVE